MILYVCANFCGDHTIRGRDMKLSTQFFNIFFVFFKMWLPWQRDVKPTLYHLCAHLHIRTFHPCKYEKNLLENEGGVIRTSIC